MLLRLILDLCYRLLSRFFFGRHGRPTDTRDCLVTKLWEVKLVARELTF
jgi:hypothetical protein